MKALILVLMLGLGGCTYMVNNHTAVSVVCERKDVFGGREKDIFALDCGNSKTKLLRLDMRLNGPVNEPKDLGFKRKNEDLQLPQLPNGM